MFGFGGSNFDKMNYFVCSVGCSGIGMDKNKVGELLLCGGLSLPSISLWCGSLSIPNAVDTFICTFCSRAALMIGLKPSGDRLMWNRWMCSSQSLPRQVPYLSLSAIYLSWCHPFLSHPTHYDVWEDLLLITKLNVLEHGLFWWISFKTITVDEYPVPVEVHDKIMLLALPVVRQYVKE